MSVMQGTQTSVVSDIQSWIHDMDGDIRNNRRSDDP
jgi:hypothetical protein